ncbi:hypothetical protein [Deinococcus aquaticus]|uniref:Uncharacterized protein n=1 Tax=Deinococcus aquaticus TaxID=328692 RepID=A0ABY7UYC2_9DEIO|nr:hypothetical protein [Deinococcus aquaticus]WDA57850.1 hypothetical protein M8445_10865 [Deinococcus aquaticus]
MNTSRLWLVACALLTLTQAWRTWEESQAGLKLLPVAALLFWLYLTVLAWRGEA